MNKNMGEKETYRKIYEKARMDSELEIDRYVKFLAGGALVLSLTFIGNIIPNNDTAIIVPWLIIGGWLFLVIALVINFTSYFLTIRNAKKAIDEIDSDKDWEKSVKKRNKLINRCNISAATVTILGVLGITLFISLNIQKVMSEENINREESIELEERSQTLPTPREQDNSSEESNNQSNDEVKK
jgi:hypothetical protein